VTATNEPKRTICGAPDFVISRKDKGFDYNIGYIETKDIGTNLIQSAKTEQISKRYVPSLNNFILTDYIEFWWYVGGEKKIEVKLCDDVMGRFKSNEESRQKVFQLLEAFLCQDVEKIKSGKELAIKLAHKARMMRDIISKTFEQEHEDGTLHGQFEAFKDVLLHDLTVDQFADMYAQTICYGLFTARCHIEDMTLFGKDKYAVFHGFDDTAQEHTRENAAYLLPKTNPFFRSIFGDIAGPKLDDRIVWLVDDLVNLLKRVDMGLILHDFAKGKKRRDPVFHFYETFLGEYDTKLRKTRGVYYTPEEVVSFIVRSVDLLLYEKFKLPRGLAYESKIKSQNGEYHKLLILDPAVGTGTFLFDIIYRIYNKFKRQRGKWSSYVQENLLPRIFGFEIMMAPYAVAHMKLGLLLAETGYDFKSDERLGIYLTNTLEEAEVASRALFAQYLSEEAKAASKVKKELPIMVVIGNPPYSISSQNRSEWILKLLDDYKEGLHEKKLNIDDDFIKFIKFGQYRIENTGCGILAFISNNTYIDGITHRRMRESLLKTFTEIYILDLHGSAKKRETCPDGSKDENVFDIQQGVCIGIFIKEQKKDQKKNGRAKIYHADLYGLRRSKYDWLNKNNIKTIQWQYLKPESEYYFFTPKNLSVHSEYMQWWEINKIYPLNQSGLQTDRDTLFFDFNKEILKKRIKEFYSDEGLEDPFRKKYRIEDSSSYDILLRRKKTTYNPSNIYKCLYRPFDDRWLYYASALTSRPAWDVMKHIHGHDNLALIGMRQFEYNIPEYCYIYVTNRLTERRVFISNRGAPSIFPCYIYPSDTGNSLLEHSNRASDKEKRIPNISEEFVKCFEKKVNLSQTLQIY
jgi:predicted helicase